MLRGPVGGRGELLSNSQDVFLCTFLFDAADEDAGVVL
jgi:hypothetical protein